MNVCYDQAGRNIGLADHALASGGEGAVYEIVGYPRKVVKKYHHGADAKKREDKIREMVKISASSSFTNAKLAQDVAWPLSQVYDQGHNFIGFGMNKIAFSTELDDLYVYPPKQNLHVTIKDRIDCLISLSDVVDRIHRAGLVFGDGNPDNLKIRDDYSVCFIDVDSFHFKSGGKTYKCEVCAPGYVAPELIKACKGTTYADCPGPTFTEETDNFSLAIHCFRMLMNGCHPFICQRQLKRAGSAPAPKSTDKRIESGETPFFKSIPNYTTPSYAPDINSLPPYIRDLFRRAFVDGHSNPKARPTPAEWKKALLRFRNEITQCKHNHTHYFWSANCSCPYCEADKRHASKMNTSMVAMGSRTSNISVPTTPVHTTVYTPPIAASPAVAVAKPASSGSAALFWSLTIVLSVILLAILDNSVLPQMYNSIAGEEIVTMIGTIGGCIAGFVGMIIYNSCWAPGRHSKCYEWYEYVLSVLTCLGFTFGFGIAMGLVYIAAVIIFYILAAAFVIGIIAAIFSGG